MIEINLLPEEMRIKARKAEASLTSANTEYLVYIIPAILALLLVTHLYIGSLQIWRASRAAALNKKWLSLNPQRQKLEGFKTEYEAMSAEEKIIADMSVKYVDWAGVLNRMSQDLVSGIWFNELVATKKELVIKGSVVSLEDDEFDRINKFINQLRKDPEFSVYFTKAELGENIVNRKLGSYTVVDFIIKAPIRSR
jgi:Tfp pilus assembly protein PilN